MNAKKIMVEYLKLKVEQEDWHGVRDAAAELEAMVKVDNAIRPKIVNKIINKVDPNTIV